MRSHQAKLRVDGLEQRLTPASAGAFLSAAGQVAAGAEFFRAIATDPDWIFNPKARSFLTSKLTTIFQGSQGATVGGASAVAALAVHFGDVLGITVNPAPPIVTPPTPTPTDAGMTNTMPSATDPNWVTGANGLKTWDVVTGSGTPVAAGDSITIFYTGWLASNGTKFDSRRSPSAPITFSLSGLIQGWQQGIPGMKPGGIRRLYIPAALGYGAAGSPPNIPANADLIFEIKLISHT
ncbi:MAG TPA: FKBP-type peptidyl-prolyl cis-trans isomerase [Gemmataceae bacterium]|nr:FKBP-type peptidyl-prolyl cis-trans isomerase [Gemmataceae bacterium]